MTNADLARAVFASVILLGCAVFLAWEFWKTRGARGVPDTFPSWWLDDESAERPFDQETAA